MTLDHVTILCQVVVVAQGSLHGQIDGRRVAYSVPSLLQLNGAYLLVRDDGTANGELAVFLHLDGIRLLR